MKLYETFGIPGLVTCVLRVVFRTEHIVSERGPVGGFLTLRLGSKELLVSGTVGSCSGIVNDGRRPEIRKMKVTDVRKWMLRGTEKRDKKHK
jgi:hypothetical protein